MLIYIFILKSKSVINFINNKRLMEEGGKDEERSYILSHLEIQELIERHRGTLFDINQFINTNAGVIHISKRAVLDKLNHNHLIYYINDVHLIAKILQYLPQKEIKKYSYSSKENRELCLKLGLIQYKLRGTFRTSRTDPYDGVNIYGVEYYKSALGLISELGEEIRNQVLKGARIISLQLE